MGADEPMRPERPEMRIADADRERVAERLGHALSEGRLELAEYERRLDAAMAAKTMGQLVPLTEDLPLSAEEQRREREAHEVERKKKERRAYLEEWRTWLGAAVVMNAIWGFSSWKSGELVNYWPGIVLGIWAAVLVAGLIWKDDKSK